MVLVRAKQGNGHHANGLFAKLARAAGLSRVAGKPADRDHALRSLAEVRSAPFAEPPTRRAP